MEQTNYVAVRHTLIQCDPLGMLRANYISYREIHETTREGKIISKNHVIVVRIIDHWFISVRNTANIIVVISFKITCKLFLSKLWKLSKYWYFIWHIFCVYLCYILSLLRKLKIMICCVWYVLFILHFNFRLLHAIFNSQRNIAPR